MGQSLNITPRRNIETALDHESNKNWNEQSGVMITESREGGPRDDNVPSLLMPEYCLQRESFNVSQVSPQMSKKSIREPISPCSKFLNPINIETGNKKSPTRMHETQSPCISERKHALKT